MNKEAVIECYFKEREEVKKMLELADKYGNYLSRESFQPANLERFDTIISKGDERKVSVIGKTLSLCSAFSRITID